MSTPSAAVLREYAAELRDLARAQAHRASSVGSLLDPVTGLDTADTWQGSYVQEVHGTLLEWDRELTATARQCEQDAGGWRDLASRLEVQADAAAEED